MKKIELHVHLDGSVRPSTVSEILDISLEDAKNEMIVSENNQNLSEYLTKFSLPLKVMQTKENLKRISKELALDLKKDEVIYAEVRFAPYFHTKEGLSYDEVVTSILEGIKEVTGIKINLILCMMRGVDFKYNLETINCAKRFLNKGVVALDLAGDEYNYKTKEYQELFEIAKKENIPFTIHAGEADGKDSILSAIDFGTTRLGHGIRCLEDRETIKKIKDNKITLEICPTSNIQTKVFNSFKEYPIKKLLKENILITINTDNRTVSNTTLNKEYNILKKYFNITNEDFLKFNINALNASFISKEEKEYYKKILLS